MAQPQNNGNSSDTDSDIFSANGSDEPLIPEDQAEGIQTTDSIILGATSDSQSDNVNNNDNQTNGTPVTSDGRVSGQTETRQNSSDDTPNDQNKSDTQ